MNIHMLPRVIGYFSIDEAHDRANVDIKNPEI